MVEVADPGAARLIFSGALPGAVEPHIWSVIVSAAGQPEVVDRYARELGHMAGAANAEEFAPLGDSEAPGFGPHSRIPKADPGSGAVGGDFSHRRFAHGHGRSSGKTERDGREKRSGPHRSYARVRHCVRRVLAGEANETRPRFSPLQFQEVFRVCGKSEINASAMLEWCPPEVKFAAGGVWGRSRPDFGLMRRVKNSFDPGNVLSPGRFAGGI